MFVVAYPEISECWLRFVARVGKSNNHNSLND